MHELGILRHVVGIVEQVAENNMIKSIKNITLEIGADSGIVQPYMEKLFPLVAEAFPGLAEAELIIRTVAGNNLIIKEIRY